MRRRLDALIALTLCSSEKAGDAIPKEAFDAINEGIKAWKDAVHEPATRQATIDACKMSLDASMPGYEAVGCALPPGASP